jgi:hypothetical protein
MLAAEALTKLPHRDSVAPMKPLLAALFVAAAVFGAPLARALTVEQGDFLALVATLKSQAFAANSGLYVAPAAQQRSDFRQLAGEILAGDEAGADLLAGPLGYELVRYTDQTTAAIYLGVREILVGGLQTVGWGSYFVNLAFDEDVLVEAPHPLFDTNTPEIAARVFRDAGARGFLMAGAHRNANGVGTADVAHLATSVFQEVHEVFNGPSALTTAYSIHGFDADNYPTYPVGIDVVASNGDGGIGQTIVDLDATFEGGGLAFYAYNTLAANDPLNQTVNGGLAGTTFSDLGGTTNKQGVFSRGLGGTFVHIEMEQSIRFNAGNRVAAAAAITAAIQVPEPAAVWLLAGGLLLSALGRRRAGQ